MNKGRRFAASMIAFLRPRRLRGALTIYLVLLLVPLIPLLASAQEAAAGPTASPSESASSRAPRGASESARSADARASSASNPEPLDPGVLAEPSGPIGSGGAPSATLDAAEGSGIGNVGRASVEPSTGVARSSIPFVLPRARGGVQPQLGISYVSSEGPGVAGLGWSMGVPSIHRHNLSNGPKYNENLSTWPTADTDRMEFMGRPLVPIGRVTSQTTCDSSQGNVTLQSGEQFPDWSVGWLYYRQQVDDFTRFFWSPNRRTWKIQGKGYELELGAPTANPDDDRALDLDTIANPSNPPVFRWNLIRQRDSNGDANVIIYDWAKFPKPPGWATDGLAYLTDVYDSVNENQPNPPRWAFAHHTHLTYRTTHPDNANQYDPFTGQVVWRRPMRFLLDRVDVMSADFSGLGNRKLTRRYQLQYVSGISTFSRWLLSGIDLYGACPSLQEQPSGDVPREYPSECGPFDTQHMASFQYYGGDPPDNPEIGPLWLPGQNVRKPAMFLDIDGDSLADVIATKDDDSLIVGRRRGSPVGAPPVQGMGIFASGLGASELLFKNALLGGWMDTGSMNGLGLTFDDPNHCGDPLFRRYFAGQFGAGWIWGSVDPGDQRLHHWMDGWDCPAVGSADFRPRTEFSDLDGDGFLDRVSLAPFRGPTGSTPVGNTRAIYLTKVDNDTREVRPFDDYSRARNPDGTPFQTIYRDVAGDRMEYGTYFNDYNGDSILDIVQHFVDTSLSASDAGTNERFVKWDGLGNGNFVNGGTSEEFPGGSSPDAYIHDLNGDQIPDAINILRTPPPDTKTLIYVRFGGGGITRHYDVTELGVDPNVPLQFADLNGSGVDSIVFSNAYTFSLTGTWYPPEGRLNGQIPRPGLLKSITNGVGATTTFEYQTAESFLYDTPYRLPQPLHVVSRVTTTSPFDVKSTGGPYVTEYSYYEPAYRKDERRFLGFGRVHTVQSLPNLVHTWSTFLLGDCGGAAWCASPAGYPADNPIEALNGRPVVIENYEASPARPPSTTHHRYRLRQLYTGLDRRTVRTAYVERTDKWYFDEAGTGSGTRQLVVNDVSSTDLPSLPPSRTVGVLQSPTGQRVSLATETELDGLGNMLSRTNLGMAEAGSENPKDVPIVQRFENWELPPGDPSRWNWRPRDTRVSDRHAHFDYNAAGHVTTAYADLSGTLPLDRFHEDPSKDVAPLPNDASQDRLGLVLSQVDYDVFGNATTVRDGGSRCSTTGFDDAFHQLPTSVTMYTNGCSGTALTTRTEFDRGLEVVTKTTSSNGMVSRTEYDKYGRPTKTFAPHPTALGTIESEPSVKMTYRDAWQQPSIPASIVHIEARDDSGGAARYRSTWNYVDPYGQLIASVRQADPGLGDGASFIVSGEVERDELGRIVKSYEPRFAEFDPSALRPPVPVPSTPATTTRYFTGDILNAVFYYARDGRLVGAIEPTALRTRTYDAADLTEGATQRPTTTLRDGHGRTVLTQRTTSHTGVADTVSTSTTYLPTGEVALVKRSHTAAGDVYTRTMRYDSFGRMVENMEPNTSTGFGTTAAKGWRYAYNNSGDLVGTSDARGCGKNLRWDSAGRMLEEVYSPCLNAQQKFDSDPATQITYDAPEPGQESGPGAQAFVGRVAAVYDRAQHTQYVYDARGRVSKVRRQLAVPNEPNETGTAYAPHWYERQTVYDAANRVIAETTGADVEKLLQTPIISGSLTSRSMVTTDYSTRGVRYRVGGSYGGLVRRTYFDADGAVTLQAFGDTHGTTATYAYNARRLLSRARVARAGEPPLVLQDVRIDGYDDVNNPTLIGDARNPDDWPEGAKPVTRSLTYDDSYQLRKVDYAFGSSSGKDKQVSPFKAEAAAGDKTPVPEQKLESRVAQQTFDYDWQGNLRNSDDDAHAFFDRSMGAATHGTASKGPNRVISAKLGDGKLDAIYDASGNLARMLVTKKDGTSTNVNLVFEYDWDEVGRLTRARRLSSAEIPGLDTMGQDALHVDLANASSGVDLRYTYEHAGQRIVKSGLRHGSQVRTFSAEIFSSLRLNHAKFESGDYERNEETESVYLVSNGTALARLVYDEDLPKEEEGGSALHVLFTITDPLGSTSVVVDKATSELVERATYLAYGQPDSDYRPERWKSFREEYRFTGKEDDVGVGLTYFGARYYVASLGQWASADPLTVQGLGSDLNPYAYVFGSPQRLVDPNGLDICELCGWDSFAGGMGPGGPTGWGVPSSGRDPFRLLGGGPRQGAFYTIDGMPFVSGIPIFLKTTHSMMVQDGSRMAVGADGLIDIFNHYKRVFWSVGSFLFAPDGALRTLSRGLAEHYERELRFRVHYGKSYEQAKFDANCIKGVGDCSVSLGGVVVPFGGSLAEIAVKGAVEDIAAEEFSAASGAGFDNFGQFKSVVGAAGKKVDWHHVVEQTTSNVAEFGESAIHNTGNLVRVDAGIHSEISAFYSTKQPFTNGATVREWLSEKSFAEQQAFGREVLRMFGIEH